MTVYETGFPTSVAPLQPSGGDDTAAVNAAVAAGQRLGAGTFKLSGLVTGYPRGQGAGKTILQATAAAARIQGGPAIGTGPTSDAGTYGDFTIDGNSTAGASNPLMLVNTVGTTFMPIVGINSLGDVVSVAGQNCTFYTLSAGACTGCALVLDNGAGGNYFINPELSGASQYHVEFRQTVTSTTYAYSIPSYNYFAAGRTERANAGANLGCVHHLAGAYNFFDEFIFSVPNATNGIYLEPNTFSGRSGDSNGRLYLRDCAFAGNSGATGIAASATTLSGDVAVVMQGDTISGGPATVISWQQPKPVRVDGAYTLYGTSTTFFTKTGSGSTLIPWTQASLNAPWVNNGGTYANVGYYKNGSNIVYLQGACKSSGASDFSVIFTLPTGFRPIVAKVFPLLAYNAADTVGFVQVAANGQVTWLGGGATNAGLWFDPISFPAEQ